MKILRLLALAAVASTARGMTDDDDDEPQQRRLNQLGASFGDAADFAADVGPGGSASVAVGMPQGDENADQNPAHIEPGRSVVRRRRDEPRRHQLKITPSLPKARRRRTDARGCASARRRRRVRGRRPQVAHVSERTTRYSTRPGAHRPGWLEIELDENGGSDGPPFAVRTVNSRFVTFDADDDVEDMDVEEEEAYRQKVRIDESGCIAHVLVFATQLNGNNLSVELDENQGENCPANQFVKTKNSRVTFLDEEGNEMDYKDVRRPYDPKLIKGGQKARTQFEEKLDAWGPVHLVSAKTTLPSFKDKLFDWCKVDTTNYKDIPVKQAPEMDFSATQFASCGRGGVKERRIRLPAGPAQKTGE